MPKTPPTSTKKKRSPYISPAVRAITKRMLHEAIYRRRSLAIRERPQASRREVEFQFQRVFNWLNAYFKLRGVGDPTDVDTARWDGPLDWTLIPSNGMGGLVNELTHAARTAVAALRRSPISQTLRAWDMDLDDLDVEILSALESKPDGAISTRAFAQPATSTNVSMLHRGNGALSSGTR